MNAAAVYTVKHRLSSVMMILALLWLTVSLPFVNEAQQTKSEQTAVNFLSDDAPVENSDDSNPFSNTTEEKAPGNSTISEEYLHGHHDDFNPDDPELSHIHFHSYGLYVAYHGELHCPPPNYLLS